MKLLRFYRSDFEHIKHLKFVFVSISIKIYSLINTEQSLEHFSNTLSEKIRSFLVNYEQLRAQINETNSDVLYFTDSLAKLGFECFNELDLIGQLIDQNIQTLNKDIIKKFDDLLEKTEYFW